MAFPRKKTAKKSTARVVRRPTPQYLENVATYYVQRYAATTATLKRVLQKRITNAVRAYPDDFNPAPFAAVIDDLIAKFVRLGYVNDETFAEQKIASLRRKGTSARAITAKLREKGIKANIESDEDTELAAAQRYVKRKRLGPYRTRTAEDSKQKDVAALARAGFSLPVARKALASVTKE